MTAPTTGPVGLVLSKLHGVKGNGAGFKALCPGHEDHNASLSIGEGIDGEALVYCFGGCGTHAILDKIGLTMRDLFPVREGTVRKSPPRADSRTPGKITRYEVQDVTGKHTRFHVREDHPNGKKSIWWEQPDGTRNLGGIKLSDLKLYGIDRLPPDGEVIIAEGEKAADALLSNGIPAVGTVTGASGTPGDDALRPLLTRPVFVWADNDDSGRKHMDRVIASLQRIGHRDLRRIEWKNAPDKGDAADLFALEAAMDEYHVLLDEARLIEPETDANEPIPIFTRCAADVEAKPIEWVWKDRLARGKLTLIASDPGLGKSLLTVAAGATVSLGSRWPAGEGRCEPGDVLMATYEDDVADTVVPRLQAAGANLSRIHFLEKVPDDNGPRTFDLSRDADRLDAHLDRNRNIRLLTIDPISVGMGGIDSHKNADVRSVLHPLADVAQRHGVAVLGITHFSKGSGSRAIHKVIGSIAFVAAARIAFVATRDQDDPTGDKHLLLPIKSNIGDDRIGLSYFKRGITLPSGIEAWRIEWGERVTTTADEAIATREEKTATDEAKEFLRSLLSEGSVEAKWARQEAKRAGISDRTLDRAKSDLKVKSGRTGLGPWWWSLP